MIVIKTNMSEMPKNCKECKMIIETKKNGVSFYSCPVGLNIDHYNYECNRHNDCPLTETDNIIEPCKKCHGTGTIRYTDFRTVPVVTATDNIVTFSSTEDMIKYTVIECPECNGLGKKKYLQKGL